MRVSIVGTGYVGLVTGLCLAERGNHVVCVDIDERRVAKINAGVAPIHETGLVDLIRQHLRDRFSASTDLRGAVVGTDATFIAVGTPSVAGRIDLSHVERAATEIGTALREKTGPHTVIVKSTDVPGTTAGPVREWLERASSRKVGEQLALGTNPEFLTEGTAVHDALHPDRIVIGGVDPRAPEVLEEIYREFDTSIPRIVTNSNTAEMIKYASNALLATAISFSNEIARLCSAIGGVDALDVMRGVHESTYLTAAVDGTRRTAAIAGFLEAGCGFGGSCLPKDVLALVAQGESKSLPMPILRSVLETNAGQPDEMIRLSQRHYPALRGVVVAVLGIAFKPDTDDVRESPALPLIDRLTRAGANVTAYDPVARPSDCEGLRDVRLAASMHEAVEGAQIIFIATRWKEFLGLPAVLCARVDDPLVVDGRRMLAPGSVARYEGIGR